MGIKFSTEHKEDLSKIRKGRTYIGAGFKKGSKLSEETKKKIGKASKNRIWSESSRKKISNSLLGHKVSDETRKKISEKNKGKLIGSKNPMKGKSLMDVWTEKYGEEEAKIRYTNWRANKKGQTAWNKGLKTKNNDK